MRSLMCNILEVLNFLVVFGGIALLIYFSVKRYKLEKELIKEEARSIELNKKLKELNKNGRN